ncbi:MAG: DUF2079 domain-containing protein [Candidatus Omnitrophota bacterium]
MGKKTEKFKRRFIRSNYQNLTEEQIAQQLKITQEEVKQIIGDLNPNAVHKSSFLKQVNNLLDKYAVLILSVFTIFYISFFYLICVLRYHSFDYSDFDLAIYAQTTWNILHGSIQSSILSIPFLGNHLDLTLFLIVPIYALFSSPLTLLFLQTLFMGLAIIPLYLLAKDLLDKKFALLFSILYLIYPALHFVNQYEFHPVSFVIFFFLSMFYFFEKKRFIPFLCFMFLSLSCKENISLGIFFFGLYVLFFRRYSWKWSLVPIMVSSLWLVFGINILHSFNKGTIDFNYIYSHIGKTMSEVATNIFKHPGITSKHIFTYENGRFLFQLFLPLGFLCLLSPKILFISLPFLLQQLLSIRLEDHTIEYHYTAKLIPLLFIAAFYGIKFISRSKFINRNKIIFPVFLIAASLASNIYFGILPKITRYLNSRYSMRDENYFKQKFVDKIPNDASAVATFEFLPKLSQRKNIYSFHHIYIDKYTLSQKEYILPAEVDYALIDFNDFLTFTSFYGPEQYKNLQKFFDSGGWDVIAAADNVVLFQKKKELNLRLYQILNEPTSLSAVKFIVEDKIVASGYNIGNRKVSSGETIIMSFVWKCQEETEKDYWLSFKLVDKEQNVLHQYNHPICYRICPTYSWKKGDIIKENLWMIVPSSDKRKEAWLKMLIFVRGTAGLKGGAAKAVPIKTNMYGLFDSDGWINLGRVEIERD